MSWKNILKSDELIQEAEKHIELYGKNKNRADFEKDAANSPIIQDDLIIYTKWVLKTHDNKFGENKQQELLFNRYEGDYDITFEWDGVNVAFADYTKNFEYTVYDTRLDKIDKEKLKEFIESMKKVIK